MDIFDHFVPLGTSACVRYILPAVNSLPESVALKPKDLLGRESLRRALKRHERRLQQRLVDVADRVESYWLHLAEDTDTFERWNKQRLITQDTMSRPYRTDLKEVKRVLGVLEAHAASCRCDLVSNRDVAQTASRYLNPELNSRDIVARILWDGSCLGTAFLPDAYYFNNGTVGTLLDLVLDLPVAGSKKSNALRVSLLDSKKEGSGVRVWSTPSSVSLQHGVAGIADSKLTIRLVEAPLTKNLLAKEPISIDQAQSSRAAFVPCHSSRLCPGCVASRDGDHVAAMLQLPGGDKVSRTSLLKSPLDLKSAGAASLASKLIEEDSDGDLSLSTLLGVLEDTLI